MIFDDNREYLDALGSLGDMVRIEQEVDWDRKTERPSLISFNAAYPEEIKNRVLENWKSYVYQEK